MTDNHRFIQRIVLKIGGSLLFSDLGLNQCVSAIQNEFPDAQINIIVGGGDTVESMRTLHRLYPHLSNEAMHWRCVKLLDATWEVLCELLPEANRVCEYEQINSNDFRESKLNAVRVGAFYRASNPMKIASEQTPKVGWETTSDALAWLLAKTISATSIVLIKMSDVPTEISLDEAAKRGIIDPELARLASADPIAGPSIHFRTFPAVDAIMQQCNIKAKLERGE